MPKYVPGLLGLYDTLMPRHPGTPVPSWPGTFCSGLQYSGLSLGSQVVQRRPTRFTSLRLAAAQEIRKSDHPTDRPQGCMSELHKLFMSRASVRGQQAWIFSLHCTVPQIN